VAGRTNSEKAMKSSGVASECGLNTRLLCLILLISPDKSSAFAFYFNSLLGGSTRTDKMNELFKTVGSILRFLGLIVRFPFFCAGLFLWAMTILPLTIIYTLWQIVCIPFVFLSSAYDNKPEDFQKHIEYTFNFDDSTSWLHNLKAWLLDEKTSNTSSSSHWTDDKRARYDTDGNVIGYEDKD